MKKGNKGFSLVEVMIAITILAIIVTPFLASFLRATKINAKSRKMLRATTVAENVMEGLSGFLIEDISKQFNDIYNLQQKKDDAGNPVVDGAGNPVMESQFLILNNRSGDSAITHMELGTNKSVNGGVFSQKPENIYEYALLNVTEDRQQFDIKVTVDANKYRDVAGEKLQTGQDYNIAAGKMFNVAEMNPKTDIVWAEPEGMEERYKDDFIEELELRQKKSGGSLDFSDVIEKAKNDPNFLSNCARMITIYIDDESASILMNLTYDPDVSNISADIKSAKKFFPSIVDATRRSQLKNIFLCYYPQYDMTKDIIQINDFTGRKHFEETGELLIPEEYHYNIYIIKQERNSSSNSKEKDYKVDLNVYTYAQGMYDFFPYLFEDDLDTQYFYPFTIRGNLGHYFEKDNPASGELQGLIDGQVSIKYDYDTGGLGGVTSRTITEEELEAMDIYDGIIRYSGIDKSTKNLIYNTIVDVYEAGAYNATNGTFDESKHIAKLDSEQAEIE
ncbi:MAG: prepilin-type N-terminal cleavage/methylation domain-containing protein [Lachnospiraceae bacterium]|nr:prepilin-type N-terminal cleavage/methylation domain-containing protein [Lachnospiraceae bacterium]